MARPTIHLISNSHLDPVWLWDWQEGLAEALALTRTVVELCELDRRFVFNRNGVLFHQWIEEYDPALFQRVRRLVRRGQWNIVGGWIVQPDCNMPSGESFVRHCLLGKRYFREKFGVEVGTAMNFDPFGHTRGLVQILAKSGYDSYIFCRPAQKDCPLPANEFTWVGYDGSEVMGVRAGPDYNSAFGAARAKVEQTTRTQPLDDCLPVLWGVGNHGGGPSRKDLRDLADLIGSTHDAKIRHSTPQRFCQELGRRRGRLPRHDGDLNPWAVGCYTSMARIKRAHRLLENELYAAEKMVTAAAAQGLMEYPRNDFRRAAEAMLRSEFHDALPGTSIPPAEATVLRWLAYGLELVTQAKTRAFFALSSGQARAREDESVILVYNPHPYRVRTIVACESQPAVPHGERFGLPEVRQHGRLLASQPEQPDCNINEDHRKRFVFSAVLEPSSMNRFDCRLKLLPRPPRVGLKPRGDALRFRTRELEIVINTRTGLIDRCRVGGRDCLRAGAARPIVMQDNADPWGMTVRSFRRPAGSFKLMSRAAGARFSGVPGAKLPAVRVIEDGPVRSVVEAVFSFGDSFICQRYKLPRQGTEVEIETRVHWNEKDRMLKLALPTVWPDADLRGQVAYGVADLPDNGEETVAQKWVAVVSRARGLALTCINDHTYGCDFVAGELRVSLLRAPAYSCHPTGPGRPLVRDDRYTQRIDQGEHMFHFWLNAGPIARRLAAIDREATMRNEPPMALCMSPAGEGRPPKPGVVLSDATVRLAAFKLAEDGGDLIVRLFEPTGRKRSTVLTIPLVGLKQKVDLAAFEIKTLRLKRRSGRLVETDLLEQPPGRSDRG